MTHVSRAHDLGIGDPEEISKRQDLSADVEYGVGWLSLSSRVGYGNGGVVADKGEGISGGTESDVLDPPGGLVQKLARDSVEGQAFSPNAWLRSLVDALDEGAQDPGMSIGTAKGEEDTVGVPRDTGDGAAERLLQVLRDPPVVFLFEVADSSDTSTTTDGKLGLAWAPSHARGCSVDAQQDEGGTPCASGRGLPDISVAVLRARDNLARARGDVNTSDQLVVSTELVLEGELRAIGGIQLDDIVAGNSEALAVGGEAVVGDRVVEQMVHLGSGHCGY